MNRIVGAWIAGLLWAGPVVAQSLDVSYGAWRTDSLAWIWSIGGTRHLLGPFDYGIAIAHVDDGRSALHRTQTGGEFTLGAGRERPGPYLVGGASLAMNHSDGNLDAGWSAGGGVMLRLLSFAWIGGEVRYRTEDQFAHGFWRLDPSDRAGWMAAGRLSIRLGSPSHARPGHLGAPSRKDVLRSARRHGIARDDLASGVVSTALDAMGTPYRWGGDDANGYDCSGLIQFAYAAHGLSLPRVSREQAASGRAVKLLVGDLAPGDILGFSVEGDRVTHVGLYVGNGQFIHSASSGVKLSSLSASDPDSLWWQHHWAAARRILD